MVWKLYRLLRSFNLSQSVNKNSQSIVIDFFKQQLHGSSYSAGYRHINLKARVTGFIVDRETIRLIIRSA